MNTNSKTSLFLMELIIVILFFSRASVVCVQLFVNAFSTNGTTKEESQSVVVIQNIAEGIYGCGGDLKALGELFDEGGSVQIDERKVKYPSNYRLDNQLLTSILQHLAGMRLSSC